VTEKERKKKWRRLERRRRREINRRRHGRWSYKNSCYDAFLLYYNITGDLYIPITYTPILYAWL